MKRRNVHNRPIRVRIRFQRPAESDMEQLAPSLEFLPDAIVLEAEWRANPALAQKLEEERAQQTNRAPGGIFLRQARFASCCEDVSRAERVARSRYEFTGAGLRDHIKETHRCYSKRHNRATAGVAARLAPDALGECVAARLNDRKLLEARHS